MVAQVKSVPARSAARDKIRVLHIVENLNGQAVESWLLRVLQASHKEYSHIEWTFYCVLGERGRHDDLARSLGAEVIHSQFPIGDKLRFLRGLRETMKQGRFDVLHSHHDIMSAAYLVAALGLPFKQRIVHLHNTSTSLPTPNRLKAALVREPMRRACLRHADRIVGISQEALESLSPADTKTEVDRSVIHYAVDTSRFAGKGNRAAVRTELNIADDDKVLLFVGRMVDYKNPAFLIEMLAALRDPKCVAVFAGAGDQKDRVASLAKEKGLQSSVRVLGYRDDVHRLMQAADLLIWPSLEEPMEGLGLGIVEAQAAGLPVLMSRSVPREAIVASELVEVAALGDGARAWADKANQILRRERPDARACLAQVEASSFSMAAGVRNLMSLYEESV